MVIQIMNYRGNMPMKCLRRDVRIAECLSPNMRHFVHIAEHRSK